MFNVSCISGLTFKDRFSVPSHYLFILLSCVGLLKQATLFLKFYHLLANLTDNLDIL